MKKKTKPMKRVVRKRRLTKKEAQRYNTIREQVMEETYNGRLPIPKTSYKINWAPASETSKFKAWYENMTVVVTGNVDSLIKEIAWGAWQAALPRVRK